MCIGSCVSYLVSCILHLVSYILLSFKVGISHIFEGLVIIILTILSLYFVDLLKWATCVFVRPKNHFYFVATYSPCHWKGLKRPLQVEVEEM